MILEDTCPDCGATDLGWVSQRFGHCRRRPVRFKIRDRSGYHPGLARFPNDPEAYVDGEDSLRRVMDKRKAQGYVQVTAQDLAPPDKPEGLDPGGDLLRASFEEARAEGFRIEDEDEL